MELDDWELSSEELDSLERDAMKRIAERNSSSGVSAACANIRAYDPQQNPPFYILPTTSSGLDSRHTQDMATPAASRIIPSSMEPRMTDDYPKQQQAKLYTKIFLHASGSIGAKFMYNQSLVDAFRKVPKSSWNAKERIWMFPVSSLSSAEDVLRYISGSNVELENLDPLVRRAIAAASSVPDLQDRYCNIPGTLESKLLPFQRDGVRFMLQHGIRVLLADEMGLGKTLQVFLLLKMHRGDASRLCKKFLLYIEAYSSRKSAKGRRS